MDGPGYEDWCADWLRRNGFHRIQRTKASHDQGIDLIAERGGLRYGFQCKYYAANVGNDAVMQAYAGMKYYGLDQAAVLTDSHFTKSARELAEETGVILCDELAPEERKSSSSWLRAAAFFMFIACAAQFAHNSAAGAETAMSFAAFGILASLCVIVFPERISALCFAAFCACVFLGGLAVNRAYGVFFFSLIVFLLLVLVQLVILLKKRKAEDFLAEREQLNGMIEEGRKDFSEHIAGLLSEQLGAPVKALGIRQDAKGTLAVVCQCRASAKEDLALAVYTLNQTAEYEKENLRFDYRTKEGTRFEILVMKRDC